MKKYYYLLNGKLYCTYKEMPKQSAIEYMKWCNSLQPCEMTEGELDRIEFYHRFNYEKIINVTDLVNDENGMVRFRDKKVEEYLTVEYLMKWHEINEEQATSLLKFANEKTIRLKLCYGNGSIIYPMWLEENKHPKQVDEASEAVGVC